MRIVVFIFAACTTLCNISSSIAQTLPSNVCEILALHLQPDIMMQGSSSQKFSQLQQIISDQRYQDFSSTSSSSNSFNLGFSIPDEVDLAIGDNQRSNVSTWQSRRMQFLSMDFQHSSSAFQNSSYLSQTSVAVVRELSKCGQEIAKSRANGVFVTLDDISPNMDSFAVQIAYRMDGNPTNWALTELHAEPNDPQFKCNGFEKASDTKPIPLKTLKREIVCSKSQNSHLTLAVNTTEGGGTAISLYSIDEKIQKFHDEMDAKIAALSGAIAKNTADDLNAISRIDAQLQYVGNDIYKCPTRDSHDQGSLGGGAWGFYGCQGQITTQPTCVIIEFPTRKELTCDKIGHLRYAP
jgi:hypothetical protein